MNISNYKSTLKCILFTLFIMAVNVEKVFAANENPVWYESKEEAFSIAKEQNKYVLLVLGKKECSYCLIAKNHINKPGLKEIAEENYILWYCDSEKSKEGNGYDSMFPSAFIPLVCIINPDDPDSPLSHMRGKISTDDMKEFLKNNLPTGNKKISDSTNQAYISGNMLILSNTFTDEEISIYTFDGQLIDLFFKKEYSITRITSSFPKGVLLISSSEKWIRKVLNKPV